MAVILLLERKDGRVAFLRTDASESSSPASDLLRGVTARPLRKTFIDSVIFSSRVLPLLFVLTRVYFPLISNITIMVLVDVAGFGLVVGNTFGGPK